MSRLVIVVRPSLVVGFQLAGVEAFGAEDVEMGQDMVKKWLDGGETMLAAIEEDLLAQFEPSLIKRLDKSETLLVVAIPAEGVLGLPLTRRARITQMIERAVGVHIAFGSEKDEIIK